jgi:hypothetical protein
MIKLNIDEISLVSGGSGKSIESDGKLVAQFEIPPHAQDQILNISLIIDGDIVDKCGVSHVKPIHYQS